METTFNKLKKNDWFKKPTTKDQIFIKGTGGDYCNIKHVYGGGRIANKDFKVIKVEKILMTMFAVLFISGCATAYHHHDNDKCLNDNKIRHSKTYHK